MPAYSLGALPQADPQSWVLLGPFGHSPCSPHISARCPCPTALPVLPPNYPQSCLSLGLARLGEEGEALDPGARRPTAGLWHCSTVEGIFSPSKHGWYRGSFATQQTSCLSERWSGADDCPAGPIAAGVAWELSVSRAESRRSSCQASPCRQSPFSPILEH